MKQPRKLKIHRKYRHRRWDCITVPEIRLEGHWLTALGFEEGQHVQVAQDGEKLVITICNE